MSMHVVRLMLFQGLLAFGLAAQADDLTGILKQIRDSGEMTVGYREASIPFSYLDEHQKPIGYSVDLCMRVVDAVKADLKLPNLKVNMNPVTSANRIPLVANGTVQIECGSTVNNVERQAQVAFSDTTFIVSTRFVTKRASNIGKLEDLRGKTVVCTAGTNTIARVNEINQKRNLGMTILSGADHNASLLMVDSGRAVAFFEDDILLTGLAANSRDPKSWVVSSEAFSIDPYALMIPKGDAAYKHLVDRTVADYFKSGAIMATYEKWFQKPIPPKGVALEFPLSPALKKAYANPTDSPDPASYE